MSKNENAQQKKGDALEKQRDQARKQAEQHAAKGQLDLAAKFNERADNLQEEINALGADDDDTEG